MKRFSLVLVCLVFGLAACDVPQFERNSGQVSVVAESVATALPVADHLVTGMEDVTGWRLSDDTVDAVQDKVQTTRTVLQTTGMVAKFLTGVPVIGPYAAAAGTALDGITGLALAVGMFLERRKRQQGQKALETVTKAVTDLPKVGSIIKDASIRAGVHKEVEAAYVKNISS